MTANINKWNVEDEKFWESTGSAVARRNLWISIPSLLCGFAVWLYWGIITVQMLNLGCNPQNSQHFLHPYRGRAQHDIFHDGVVDVARHRCRFCVKKRGYTIVDIPAAGPGVRLWRW